MATKVHYEDNLFLLMQLARTLEAGMRLDVDPEFFRDKIIEDLIFLSDTLAQMFESLKDKTHLIHRREHLRSLLGAEQKLLDILTGAHEGSLAFAEHLEHYRDRLRSLKAQHNELRSRTRALLEMPVATEEIRDQVSEEEFRFLLRDEESDSTSS